METYLTSLITSEDNRDGAKADKLCYWLQDWMTFLSFENEFSPMSLRRYKRGEIIKVHLGFNVGSDHLQIFPSFEVGVYSLGMNCSPI